MDLATLWIVSGSLASVGLLAGGHLGRRWARERRDAAELEAKRARGQHLARSLHPVIDPNVCIGSLSCLRACPEGDILGIVDGAAKLVHADHCIGHGRCAAECPVGAIRLVFGTAERGVDLPEVDEFFESSRPGVHVVGELGGMGLIKNAIQQGLQVAERLAETASRQAPVAVVGAGPAGIATALGLKARGVPFRLLEQGTMGGSIAHYPRKKVAMTEPVDLPLVGRFGKRLISKEELLASWQRVLAKAGIAVEEGVKVTGLDGEDGRFELRTDRGTVQASKVVLAVGRRGTPRKLGVPGEEQEKVLYGLRDPEAFDGNRVLVVGGGDAALEAAIQLATESSAEVTLSYRGAELARCREANRARLQELAGARRVRLLLGSQVTAIRPRQVVLEVGGRAATLENDFVVVNVGGELPLELLSKAGVALRRYHGEAPGQVRRPGRARPAGRGAAEARPAAGAGRAVAERRRRRAFHAAYALAGVAILAVLAWKGREYYPLARLDRLRSPLHPSMKPAGPWGHGVGIVATLFMLSNFLYAVRKRWKRFAPLGSIRGWLDFHVFVGFMSPLVIAFHSAFQSNNLLATGTAGALCIVVGTGIVGRFIYGTVPSDGGKAVELADLLARFERSRAALGPLLQEAGAPARVLLDRATAPVRAGSLALLFVRMPAESLLLRLRLLRVRGRFRGTGHYAEFRATLVALARLRWQIRFYASLKRLLRGWRVFHASLAVFLVLVIAAHIGVSLYLGYGLLHR
ncbi:NAD(P)-binding domain-containing protein [Anaeromyxobacter dehalogenans]|uniref:FAD-dependent pyridine nucleotide-disulfide oxidoreductase n=1 Tax=Anaeromyxobacter dehalogenans (strain 2CP-C) TaxID=290397 RepID=Q2ILA9_ANADE|nr:NAD(P)-binding domain-containing protein [Anaeromyxobacter dehalogenans]ABC82437.1 FAD-dependent pyridine nucleotide-disulfide oxidoreductase [Anaeromyxobacter dehalogenans 2CP-C]